MKIEKIINEFEPKSFDQYEKVAIQDLFDWLNDAKSEGVNFIQISGHGWEEVAEIRFEALIVRPETDEEYEWRHLKEQQELHKRRCLVEQKEREMYETLKQKFG